LVKVTQVDTPYFKIITSADAHQKVGPGLPVVYKIQFLPEENKVIFSLTQKNFKFQIY
jgi:hydrocephalus-inducing protein